MNINNRNNNNNNRRRGRNNSNRGGGGGGNQGNRIDSRARGNAPQMLEKYRKMAHDASLNGDRVQMEYYLQFADHYFRVLADSRVQKDEQQRRQPGEREPQSEEFFEEEDEFEIRSRPYETRRERAREVDQEQAGDGPRPAEAGEAATDDGAAENPFLREERPRRSRGSGRDGASEGARDGNRERDGNRGEYRSENRETGRDRARDDDRQPRDAGNEGGIDAGILPPSIAREDAPAPKRALRPRKPRKAEDGDAEALEAVS